MLSHLQGCTFFRFLFQKKETAVENSFASNADNFQNAAFHMRETHRSAHAYPKAELQHLRLFPVLSSRWGLNEFIAPQKCLVFTGESCATLQVISSMFFISDCMESKTHTFYGLNLIQTQ